MVEKTLKDYCHIMALRAFVIAYHILLFRQKFEIMSKIFVCFHTINNQAKISKDLQMIAFLLDGL